MQRILLFIFLFTLAACTKAETAPVINTIVADEPGYTLAPSPFAIEIIEAQTGFVPPLFRANDREHLSYELTILNNNAAQFNLKRIEIVDPKNPTIALAKFEREYLEQHFLRHGKKPPYGDTVLNGNSFGVANLWVSLENNGFPDELFHRLTFGFLQEGQEIREFTIEAARFSVPGMTDITLGLPFPSGKWFFTTVAHRDSRAITQGRASYAQRFAIDWAMVDEQGSFVAGKVSENESYPTYGVELIAVADGTVIATQDGIGENNPETGEKPVRMTRETGGGNYVLLDIGNGVNAFYAHLIPGSLRVQKGDRVTKGDVLGLLGNSGDSDGPHLHFHVETQTRLNKPLSGEGVPYHFTGFDQLSQYSDEQMETLFDGTHLQLDGKNATSRDNALPNGHGLVEFK